MNDHEKEGKAPLATNNIPFSNGNKYEVFIRNQTKKYRQYIMYCEFCSKNVLRRTYVADNSYKILFYEANSFFVMDHTSLSLSEVQDFSSQKIHILSGIEHFSRHIWCKVVIGQTTDHVCNFLKSVYLDFKTMKTVKTDNGKAFNSVKLASLCKSMNIHQSFSFPYNSRSNGAIERSHGPLKEMLLRECRVERSKRDENLTSNEINSDLQKM